MKYDFNHVEKTNEKIIKLDIIETKKCKLKFLKNLIFLKNVDIDNNLTS